MAAERLGGSFRDPAGFVYRRDGVLYRQVEPAGAADYDRLVASGLYDRLVAERLLVPHEEVGDEHAASPGAHRVLRPREVPFVSHPYEWSFGQLKDAALLTLEVQRLALLHGMSLKDASAYNVQFDGGRPILIDTLSFERLEEGAPWVAYRQFCQHFLAPLALMAHRDVRLGQLARVHLDGVPLDLAARLLPLRARLRPSLLLHLVLHARSQKAAEGRAAPVRGRLSRLALEGLVDDLQGAVRALRWAPEGTAWGDYYGATNYSDAAFDAKKAAVRDLVALVAPSRVFDLGANTGVFSRLAAEAGADVVAFDIDPAAVEKAWLAAAEAPRVLPLLLDLANPSPALGWAGEERASLEQRGPADLVLALALVHHLAIGNNVPLPRVAAWLARLGHHLVVEFVPKEDSQVRRMLATRKDVFADYTQDGFEAAFAEHFDVVRTLPLEGTARVLYLMEARRTPAPAAAARALAAAGA